MTVIDKFLGKTVDIPDDRRYVPQQGLWGKKQDRAIVFGLTQAALILLNGLKSIDWLTEDGRRVSDGESIVFAITGKILYLDAPLSGTARYNSSVKDAPEKISADPYGDGWLFSIEPDGDADQLYLSLVSAEAYLNTLRETEGFKNPEGLKGGVSGICKAVYSGIGQQKI